MNESDLPAEADDTAISTNDAAGDPELDTIAADLDTVEAAMKALDADELDQAETLARSLHRDASADRDAAAPGPASAEA